MADLPKWGEGWDPETEPPPTLTWNIPPDRPTLWLFREGEDEPVEIPMTVVDCTGADLSGWGPGPANDESAPPSTGDDGALG